MQTEDLSGFLAIRIHDVRRAGISSASFNRLTKPWMFLAAKPGIIAAVTVAEAIRCRSLERNK